MKATNPGYCPACGYYVDSHGYSSLTLPDHNGEVRRQANCDCCGAEYVDIYRLDRQSSHGEVLAVAADPVVVGAAHQHRSTP